MNNKIKTVLVLICIVVLAYLPSLVSGETYGSVTCTYYYPIGYVCSDGHFFFNRVMMIGYYVPPMEQTTPDYTFVTGAPTEGLTVEP